MKSTSTNKEKRMVTYSQALEEILQCAGPLPSEEVNLEDSLRRVLSEPVRSTIDLPLFNNSAVDGYGVLVQDLIEASDDKPVALKLTGEIAAGIHDSLPEVNPGQCVRILTGAQTPGTAEAVVMKEFCRLENSDGGQTVWVSRSTRIGENIRLQGEEIEAGATVLPAGTTITPPVLGLLASLGQCRLAVHRLPSVAVISTGDELREPGQDLALGQIYNSNSYALKAALNAIGINSVSRHHCLDNRQATKEVLAKALAEDDIIITAGGVSVGEYDYVKEVLEELGVTTRFWKIAIKPGKPVYFGVYNEKLVFGLPGNPVSALVTFQLFVKPALLKLLGNKAEPQKTMPARLARNLKKKAGRLDFVRGKMSCGEDGIISAMPVTGQESHMLSGLANADCLLHFDQELEFLPEGEKITIELLNWFE